MNRRLVFASVLATSLSALLPGGTSVAAQEGWRGAITNISITSRSNMTAFLERVEERKDDGYHCIDVEIDGSTVWGIFAQCSDITDSEVRAYQLSWYGSVRGDDWHLIDSELTGFSSDGPWFCQVHIQTEEIDGDGYFGRSNKTDFKDRIGEAEASGYTVTDFGYMDGKWRALISKETGVFRGNGVLDGRTSFSDLSNRTAGLNALGKRVLDIEYIGGRWYLYARESDDLGASGLYSRTSFSEFLARTQELEADGKFLVDMEIVDGKFYGLVVDNG